jgi:anti-sigma factor RsiW
VNCSQWERQLALLVEGDIGEREAREVEVHLAACSACREFVAELRESQAALRELGGEEVDGVALAAVRHRVLAQVESRTSAWRFVRRWWHAVPVGVAAAVMMAVVLWPRVPEVEPPPALAVWTPPAPEVVRSAAPPVMRRVPEIKAAVAAEPLLVKFFTDDPDVVIYWIIDQNGGKS